MGRKDCSETISCLATQRTTAFEAMVAADVMVDASSQRRQVRNDQVAFRRMQVAARRIAAQRQRDPWYCFQAERPSDNSKRTPIVLTPRVCGEIAPGRKRSP